MKLEILAILSTYLVATRAHDDYHAFYHRHSNVARQVAGSSVASAVATGASSASSGSSGASPTATSAPATPVTLPSGIPTPAATGPLSVPPLNQLTSGMPSGTSLPLGETFTPGAEPTYSGAPPLPSTFIFVQGTWPTMDVVAPTNSTQVAQWMTELDGVDIPNITPTLDGDCGDDPTAALNAQANGWWTCGGWTRDTDIVACPDKLTWGVSFDDGPSPYSEKLLNFLDEKALKATFFVVGSRVIERPDVLVEEYMKGHEISVHTWSHHPLTSLTNEQIVAELGWTREAIKTVLGITPTTMRPPYGDIDDRVRAISLAMGLTPIIWTSTPSGIKFDTNDWRVAGGQYTGPESYESFEDILGNATTLDTGFIVLEHDLYEITVDLAIGYTLNTALNHQPPFTLMPIGQCSNIPTPNMYMETTTNQTYLAQRAVALSHANDTSSDNSTGTSSGSSSSSSNSSSGSSGSGTVAQSAATRSYAGLPVLTALVAAGFAFFL